MTIRTASSIQGDGHQILKAPQDTEPLVPKGGAGDMSTGRNGSPSATVSSLSSSSSSSATTAAAPTNVGQDSLVHALAGGLGSAIALALTYPLDQIRTFQQGKADYSLAHSYVSVTSTSSSGSLTPLLLLIPLLFSGR